MSQVGQFLFQVGESTVFLPPGETLIGSGPECAVKVAGEKVEPVHAAARAEDSRVLLQVRASAGDVAVNGKPLRVEELKSGDKVRFGDVELTVQGSGQQLALAGGKGTFPLHVGENKVGRSPENAVNVEDNSVSRSHAAILMLPSGQTRVRDLGSSNGTFVNGRRLGERELAHGDQVEIGGQKLVFLKAPSVGAAAVVAPAGAAAPAGPRFELTVGGATRELASGTHRIGRAPDCEISLPDDSLISRYHAQLAVAGGQARLKDLGSSNGTRLNGESVSAEVVLEDGDRIGVGGQELLFKATVPFDPLGKTVVAQKLPLPDKTTMMPKVAPAAAGGRDGALALLELPAGASREQIQKRYQELYSDFQVRLTNAPTADLKKKYTQKLAELRDAFELLVPPASPSVIGHLPAAEPIEGAAEAAPPPVAPAARAAAAPAVAAAAVKPEAGPRRRGIPASTLIVLALGLVAMHATGAFFVLWQAAAKTERALAAEVATKQEAIAAMQARIPQAQKELEALKAGRMPLAENKGFKVCNGSGGELWVIWIHSAWLDESGQFRSFNSADVGYPQFPIAGGGTGTFEWVSGDTVVWDGSSVFFALSMIYRGQEYFRSGSVSQLETDCYAVNLDQ